MKQYDVLIIGGGIAGTSLAYELSETREVGLLDMESTLGFHTTGRSAAAFLESYGSRTVRIHVAGSRSFFENPPEGFDGPLLTPRSLIWVAPEQDVETIVKFVDSVREFVPDAELIGPEEVVKLCPVLDPNWVAKGLVEPGASDLDVHALHQGFIRGMRRRGGEDHISAKVVSLSHDGNAWTVETASGDVFRAPIVVNAAGAWGDEVAELAGIEPIGLHPMLRDVFVVARPEVPDGYDFAAMPLVHDIVGRFYFKPEGDGVLCSPADELPAVPCDAKPDEESIARAIDEINDATTLDIRHVKHSWAGLRTFVADRTPVACFEPDFDGFFWFVGQGGYGVETAPALARSAAAILGGAELPEDLTERGLAEVDLHRSRLAGMTEMATSH